MPAQQPFLSVLGPPYVYHVQHGDEEGFVNAVREALDNPIDRYVMRFVHVLVHVYVFLPPAFPLLCPISFPLLYPISFPLLCPISFPLHLTPTHIHTRLTSLIGFRSHYRYILDRMRLSEIEKRLQAVLEWDREMEQEQEEVADS